MAILMLETKQRFINTDHIVTAYVTGRETDARIVLKLVNDEITLNRHYKSFTEAEGALKDLATSIAEDLDGSLSIEMRKDGIYR